MGYYAERPVIALACCQKQMDGYLTQTVNEIYIEAITAYGGTPVLLPSAIRKQDMEQLLPGIDGFLFPGSHSNVAPEHYGSDHDEPMTDMGRDELVFNLIRYALDSKVPALGICRGFQEMNVALGGSLHQRVTDAGFDDHSEKPISDFSAKYAAAHPVHISKGGQLEQWLEGCSEVEVNTLHNQGINRLAEPLRIEAYAPDGLIEAFSLQAHPYFIGVQWHPEWQAQTNSFSQHLFRRFIRASSEHKKVKVPDRNPG